MPNTGVPPKRLSIHRSGKVLQAKFASEKAPAELLFLRARRR